MTTYRPNTDARIYRPGYNPAFLKRVLRKREKEDRERARLAEEQAAAAREQAGIEAAALIEQSKTVVEIPVPSEAIETVLPSTERLSAVSIIRHVAKVHQVSFHEITSDIRSRHLVAARHAAMYEVRTRRPDLTLPQIGKIFGGRDHTTVLHAIRKIEAQRSSPKQEGQPQ